MRFLFLQLDGAYAQGREHEVSPPFFYINSPFKIDWAHIQKFTGFPFMNFRVN